MAGASGAGSPDRAINLVAEPSQEVRRMLDKTIRTATPEGAYCIGRAVEACHNTGIAPTPDLLESLRLQTSMRIGESVLGGWLESRVRRALSAP